MSTLVISASRRTHMAASSAAVLRQSDGNSGYHMLHHSAHCCSQRIGRQPRGELLTSTSASRGNATPFTCAQKCNITAGCRFFSFSVHDVAGSICDTCATCALDMRGLFLPPMGNRRGGWKTSSWSQDAPEQFRANNDLPWRALDSILQHNYSIKLYGAPKQCGMHPPFAVSQGETRRNQRNTIRAV